MSPILENAHALVVAGFHVFPIVSVAIGTDGKKIVKPVSNWRDAGSNDPATVESWWGPNGAWPDATHYAIDCERSGVVVVDADGLPGIALWNALEPDGAARCRFVVATPGGGRHYFYEADADHPVSIDASGKVAPGVDIRGNGGLVFGPGSHDSRGSYAVLTGPDKPSNLTRVPGVVIERMAVKASAQLAPVAHSNAGINTALLGNPFNPFAPRPRLFTMAQATEYIRPHVEKLREAPPGTINETLRDTASLIGHFVPAFWDVESVTTALLAAQLRPFHDPDDSAARKTIAGALAYGMREPYHLISELVVPSAPLEDGAPEPEPGDQAFDYAVAEQLHRMRVREAARLQFQAIERPPAPEPMSLQNLLLLEDDDVRYRVAGLMPSDAITLLAAAAKAGKTTLVGNLIKAIADGTPFMGGFHAEQGRVMLIDTESSPNQLRSWLRSQDIKHRTEVGVMSLRGVEASLDVNDPDMRRKWAQTLAGYDVVILDLAGPVLASLGKDENKNDDVGTFWINFRSILHDAGVPDALIVHHAGHNEGRAVGASAWLRYPGAIWNLIRENESPASHRYFNAYGRDVDVMPGLVTFDSFTRGLTFTGQSAQAVATASHGPGFIEWLREEGRQPVSSCVAWLRANAGMTQKAARDALLLLARGTGVQVSPRQLGDASTSTYYQVTDSTLPGESAWSA